MEVKARVAEESKGINKRKLSREMVTFSSDP